jgi:hypothetical protein
METPDLVQFIKEMKGSEPWNLSSVIRVTVSLFLKIQLFINLSKEQKAQIACNLIKKVLEEEKDEFQPEVFTKIMFAVDEILPSVIQNIPIPELPKVVTRWFSLMPCSGFSVGLRASEQLVSLAEPVLKQVSDAAAAIHPAAGAAIAPLVEVAEKAVAEVEKIAVQIGDEIETQTEKQNQSLDETKTEKPAEDKM